MISIMCNGFITGLLLQIAIGPVFFFILNVALQRTVIDGLFAVLAVTIVDYIFIALAVLGVGKLLEKPKIELSLGLISSIVLVIFGIVMILTIEPDNMVAISIDNIEPTYFASFISAFLLTVSSPLTIVFWTSLFAARAIERGYAKKQLIVFGMAAGCATFVFLGSSVTLLSMIRTSIPLLLLRIGNLAVGTLLIAYGIYRLVKIIRQRIRNPIPRIHNKGA